MVNFCEGTRYTAEKNAEARVFAKSRGYHEPEMTLFPRSKGFVATMHGLRKSVASVACTTFAFPEGKQPNFLSLLTGPCQTPPSPSPSHPARFLSTARRLLKRAPGVVLGRTRTRVHNRRTRAKKSVYGPL